MTLEDFFTLTEMKDGLTAPARVKELVNVMKKEKDCIVKNVGDATRQWSTVASSIAATEDKDCLDVFVHSDGLWFIDSWLKDAQKFGNDSSDSFVEESINALLRALEKLHIDYEKSRSCGIWMTVKNLLGHSSPRVQDRARALCDSWKQDSHGETLPKDVEKIRASHADGIKGSADIAREEVQTECSAGDIALSGECCDEGKHGERATDEMMPSICPDVPQPLDVDGVQTLISDEEKTLDPEVVKDERLSDPVGSSILKPVKEDLAIKEESPLCHSEGTATIETCNSVVSKQGIEGTLDVPESNEYTDKVKQIQDIATPLNKLGAMEISSVSLVGDSASNAQESVTEPSLQNDIDTKDEARPKNSPTEDMREDVLEGQSGMDATGSARHHRSTGVFQNHGQEYNTDISFSSGNEGKLRKLDPYTSSSSEDVEAMDRVREHARDEREDQANDSNFLKPSMDSKDPDVVKKNRTDLELDYMVDALEVARQVAIEVEREVADRKEPSCSSSEKIPEGGTGPPDSPESIHGNDIEPFKSVSEELPTGPNLAAEALPNTEEHLSSAKNLDSRAEDCVQDIESSQVTAAAQVAEVNAEKGLVDFDLNQELLSEDMDRPINPISSPVSVVSASRAAAAPGLPVAPLQFEGAHGWKGSAATSAFRPASPRRIVEDVTLTTEGSHDISKQRQDCLDFDLNVAEASDDKAPDLIPGKQILVSSGFPFGESSIETSPRRPERRKLDLNCISDDVEAPSDWRMEGRLFHRGNGHRSPSPSSSSSSMQPALRNIDLNDQPSFPSDSSDLHPYLGKSSQNLNAYGVLKSDDSVISILGTRVEVKRKDIGPQTPPLPNGRILEPTFDINLARSGGVLGMGSAFPYAHAHPPVFGYNGLTTGPAVTFSSAMYGPAGPVPYMIDSRGAPVVPQIVGSASASPAAYSQPPFIMGMIETPSGSNGAGPSRLSFDLNSGLMTEGGNREPLGLRQLLDPGQSRSMDEHLRANSHPSSGSGGFGKRKEPDSGWESYPFNFKHHQPPWK
ncbi:Altered inheritance of mitochondria protein [Actinidia chinensis var. chinensis]|uniref:Altered inheritance of mitochondria protein n=1 Tax=Actinidia chinensis var. chinensis TaxID=1590841 RepID=A0A2R6RMI6_ACTCC|nr:Altered inheritance of mitochondria protein [Actinidia chinensis var. chinensis]